MKSQQQNNTYILFSTPSCQLCKPIKKDVEEGKYGYDNEEEEE